MLPFLDRYNRQRKLPEIGAAGQRRIEGLRVRVASGPGSLIELAYLERAGVGQLEIAVARPGAAQDATRANHSATADAPSFPHANIFTYTSAREVAAAAWRARSVIVGAVFPAQPEAGEQPEPREQPEAHEQQAASAARSAAAVTPSAQPEIGDP